MKKLRVYLDTSVINFLFADDAPDFRRITESFFRDYASRYKLFVSRVVLAEIEQAPDPRCRARLLAVLQEHPIAMLPVERAAEVERLAGAYLAAGVIPRAKPADALHVAYATVFEMDVLLSWNFKHLANVRRETRVLAVNLAEGYDHALRMVSPLEVEDEDD
jgi:predicted nucleic acid-binding protein